MALSLLSCSTAFAPQVGVAAPKTAPAVSVKMETVKDLEDLANKLNPILGYYNPLGLGDDDHLGLGFPGTFWGGAEKQESTIGWLRQSEIKHGRISMFAFVGYCVGASGLHWPWNIEPGRSFADISAAGGPGDQWDALSSNGKWQILTFIGLLELIGESSYALGLQGEKHYMRGGKPGTFPKLKGSNVVPHPVPFNLFDPIGIWDKKTDEQKARGLLVELNNGRLAMIGIIGVLTVSKGGVVPGLDSLPIAPYAGDYMAPFAEYPGFFGGAEFLAQLQNL